MNAKSMALMAAVLLLIVMGTLLIPVGKPYNDQHSYDGGVKYVNVRSFCLGGGIDGGKGCPSWPVNAESLMAACREYVDAGMYELDGYTDGNSFLIGCKDALK